MDYIQSAKAGFAYQRGVETPRSADVIRPDPSRPRQGIPATPANEFGIAQISTGQLWECNLERRTYVYYVGGKEQDVRWEMALEAAHPVLRWFFGEAKGGLRPWA